MTAQVAQNYWNQNTRTEAEIKTFGENQQAIVKEVPGGTGEGALTIASDAITPPNFQCQFSLDTEGGASSDNLTNITATNCRDGYWLILRIVNSGHAVNVKDTTGNIRLQDNRDWTMTSTAQYLILTYRSASTTWHEIARGDLIRINKLPGAMARTELTIASGAITPNRWWHSVDTESDGATDDLVTINTTSMDDGMPVYFQAENTSRDVVFKHGTGNIFLVDGADCTLSNTEQGLWLARRGSNWYELARSGFASTIANQNARKVYAGPADYGADAAPAFRYLNITDLQALAMQMADVRLTTESGVAVSPADRTSQGTLYLTPTKGFGNFLSEYDGSAYWRPRAFAEISLPLTLTSGTNYDVYVYWTGSAFALEVVAWTNDTTRATALALQDNQYVKTGATTRRYVGTIRASGSNVVEDSAAKRYVYSHFNQVRRKGESKDLTDSYAYTTATTREIQGGSTEGTSRIGFVLGLQSPVRCRAHYGVQTSSAAGVGIGLDSSTTYSGFTKYVTGSGVIPAIAEYADEVAAGYHTLRQLENGQGSGSCTWYGDAGVAGHQMIGMQAEFFM